MKFLGIDYGDKRIGIAVSDEGGVFAFPRAVLPNTEKIFDEIKKICAEEKIEKIIVGVPISFSGAKSGQADTIGEFGKKLQSVLEISMEFMNEIFTTKIAGDDAGAAALILQSYLDRQKAVK